MELTLQQAGFAFLSAVILVFSVMTVTTRRIMRSATYLLFVLFATAGIYFQLDYSFLGAVQLLIYAGGIIVLFVFSILLTRSQREKDPVRRRKVVAGLLTAGVGAVLCGGLLCTHLFGPSQLSEGEIEMHRIGYAMMGTGKYQYLLPFEAISVLLLACIIGGVLIARKRK
ncbi:MAG: NADH-quinone oxidoreductase subunit J [Alistipes sp.]|nr:NADH-quinone oxidoreductase subunit J [Alistipes sp.]